MSDNGPDTPPIAHRWEPIEDLPTNWHDLCRPDLHAVHRQWVDDRNLIKDKEKVRKFQDRLYTIWAIETGVIERLYTVDRGVTVALLEAGMDALEQLHTEGRVTTDARALIEDQHAALQFLMNLVGGSRTLTASYIKELHQGLTRRQEHSVAEDQFGKLMRVPLLRGDWKKQQNNPRRPDGSIHEYCPPEQVQSEIDKLLAQREKHELLEVCPEVEAAWLHHRFSQIHPFQDGNGRVARALTGAVFLKADYLVLVIRDEEHRERYIDALESADAGDLKPLVDLFADVQLSDLEEAIATVRSLRGETVVALTESIAERARRRQEASQVHAAGVMGELVQTAHTLLGEAKGELERAFTEQGVTVFADVFRDDADKQGWWSRQIIDCARKHGYYAELDRPRRWVSLRLGLPEIEREQTRFVISLHAIGRAADLHAATAFLTRPVEGGEGFESGTRWESEVVSEHPFRFGAETELLENIDKKFRIWLRETIDSGLSVWGERL